MGPESRTPGTEAATIKKELEGETDDPRNQQLRLHDLVRTTPDKVFEAITNPESPDATRRRERLRLEAGLPMEHVRKDADRTVDLVGEVLEHTPPRRLVITWPTRRRPNYAAQHSR